MTTTRIALLAALTAALAGCATTQSLSPDAAAALRGQTLAVVSRPAAPFQLNAARRSMLGAFGAIGAAIQISEAEREGAAVAQQHRLQDPTPALAQQLAQSLQRSHGARLVPAAVPFQDGGEAALAAAGRAQARYLLDLETTAWQMTPRSATRYTLMQVTRARLIDTQTAQVVGQAFCRRLPPPGVDDQAPTYDEMLANGAARLKQHVQQKAEECLGDLRAGLLPA